MKSRRVMALLLSMVLSFSTCVPLGSITAYGAEPGVTAKAVEAEGEISDSEENKGTSDAADTSSETESASEDKADAVDEALSKETQEESAEEVAEEAASDDRETVGEADETDLETVDKEASDEAKADVPAQESGSSETEKQEAADSSEIESQESGSSETESQEEAESSEAESQAAESSETESQEEAESSEAESQEAGSSETEKQAVDREEAPSDSEETPVSATETSAEGSTEITAPVEIETIKTDAQNAEEELTSEDFSKAEEIKVGDSKEVTVNEDNRYVMYRFVPEETGAYYFYSSDKSRSYDNSVTLYDSEKNQVGIDYGYEDSDFTLNSVLTKGKTYYYKAEYHCSSGTYNVHLEKKDFACQIEGKENITVVPNEEVTLEVSAISSSKISFQWHDNDDNAINGATSAVYTFKAQKSGTYYCHVSDENGNSENLYFYIQIDNNLIVYPEGEDEDSYSTNIYVPLGDPVELTAFVSANDMAQLTYEWTDDDSNLITTTNSPSYMIDSVTSRQVILLQVSDQYGNCDVVYFNIRIENHLNIYPEGEDKDAREKTIYVTYEECVDLKVSVSADDMSQLTYTWVSDYEYITPDTPLTYKTDPIRYRREYDVHVEDQFGNSDYVTFTIYVINHLTAYPEGGSEDSNSIDIKIVSGQSVTLKAIVSADNKKSFYYTWYQDVWDYEEDHSIIEDVGYGSAEYTTGPLTQNQYYSLSIYDVYGNYEQVSFNVIVSDLQSDPQEQIISANQEISLAYGKNDTIKVSGAVGTLNYKSSNSSVASVDSTGKVTAKKVGTAEISVFAEAVGIYKQSNTLTIKVTVTSISIKNATVSGIKGKTYNGKAQTQTPVVKVGSKTLTADNDYTIAYSNNVNVGTATVNITGKGNYTGTVEKNFNIKKAAQNFTVKAAASSINAGKTTKVTATGAKETKKYTFATSNASIATVSSAGTVTGKSAGTVTITVKTAATKNYNAGTKSVKITVKKVLKKPGNCHFVKWNNSKYTSCRIAWKKVVGADGYQTRLSWTNGTHASTTYTKSNVLYRNCTVNSRHVSQMKVRAYYMQNGKRRFGPWSDVEYITPSPTKLTTKNTSKGTNLKMKISWNVIYGCNGYNVLITTNPNGKWYLNQSTPQNANSTSAVITKCGKSKLKKNQKYYVRIVTRCKRNNVFYTVPMPSKSTNIGYFIIK